MPKEDLMGDDMADKLPNDVVWIIDPKGTKPVLEITVYKEGRAALSVAMDPTTAGNWNSPVKYFEKLDSSAQVTLPAKLVRNTASDFGIRALSPDPGREASIRIAVKQDGKIVKAIGAGGVTLNKNGESYRSIDVLVANSAKAAIHYFSVMPK